MALIQCHKPNCSAPLPLHSWLLRKYYHSMQEKEEVPGNGFSAILTFSLVLLPLTMLGSNAFHGDLEQLMAPCKFMYASKIEILRAEQSLIILGQNQAWR